MECRRCCGAGDVSNNTGWSKCRQCDGSGVSPASVECPYCKAPAGEGCYRHGAHMQGQADYFHKPRIVAASRSTGLNAAIRDAVAVSRKAED